MLYNPHTDEERREMLEAVGVSSVSELFKDIPAEIEAPRIDIPGPRSELEVREELKRLQAANKGEGLPLFLGAGAYNHYVPAAVSHLVMRSEFYTAYTPYQPETSQGMLQAIFEYQTMMCELTGLDVSNASLYDGGTAVYEAAIMAMRATKLRNKVLVDEGVNPLYRSVLRTYSGNLELEFIEVPHREGRTDFEAFRRLMDSDTAAVVVQNPNFFGVVQDFSALAEAIHELKGLMVMAVNPVAAAVLKSAGEQGADIAVGEGQPLGSPLFFGGPYVGFLTARQKLVRQMPGRIISETVDREGRRGFVMTLQTREQHIRRAKATSNICTNQGLVALTACVYLALVGKEGLREVAVQNLSKAEYAKKRLSAVEGVRVKWDAPTFNEFVLELPSDAGRVAKALVKEHGIVAGLPLGGYYDGMERDLLVCVTETNTAAQIDAYAEALGRVL